VSLSSTFPENIPVDSLEEYDSGIFRTISTPFSFPHDQGEFNLAYDFFFAKNVNPIFSKFYDNLEYLEGYSKLYNNILPIDSTPCVEYGDDVIGVDINSSYEVIHTKKEIRVYKLGVLLQTLKLTQFGEFFDIRGVALNGNELYILDGNFIIKLTLTDTTFNFVSFFGGTGNNTEEYLFTKASKIIVDGGLLYIMDIGAGVLKAYNSNLSFLEFIDITGAISVDVVGGVVYEITPEFIRYNEVSIAHGITNPLLITVDSVQLGFVWVANSNEIKKFATNGLFIASRVETTMTDLVRYGTGLFRVSSGVMNHDLEYQFSQSILDGSGFATPLSAINILPDELATDYVVNDSFVKIYNNLDDFSQRVNGRFVSTLDGESNLLDISIEPVSSIGLTFDHQILHRHDEVVSCHPWERTFSKLYSLLEDTRDQLFGIEVFDTSVSATAALSANSTDYLDSINWSLGAQSCCGVTPQLFNPQLTPLSLKELSVPALSCIPLCICDDALYFGMFGAAYNGGSCSIYSEESLFCEDAFYDDWSGAEYNDWSCSLFALCEEALYDDESGAEYIDGSCAAYDDQ